MRLIVEFLIVAAVLASAGYFIDRYLVARGKRPGDDLKRRGE